MRRSWIALALAAAASASLAQQAAPPAVAPPTAPPSVLPPPVLPPPVLPPPVSPAPVLPPPGSLTTPPAAPNPLAAPPPQNQSPRDQQPPGTTTPSDDQKTPEVGGPTEIELDARPVIMLRGQSTWDDGFDTLTEAFRQLRNEASKSKIATIGRPRAAFTATDDFGFKFEAMMTLEIEPAQPPAGLGKDYAIGKSPAGRTLKFTHTGAYDDIDTTYEAITAYLDEKGLKARNIFVEEYMNDPKTSEDPALEMNIYVLIE